MRRRQQAQWGSLVLLVLSFAVASSLWGQPAKKPADDVEWGNDAKKPAGGAADAEWGGGGVNIPVERNAPVTFAPTTAPVRSEERRVGKECRARWSPERGKT